MTIKITSPVFEEGGMIPGKFTCDGENISPPLQWENVPGDAKSIALVSDDPDAPVGTWVHWVVYNMPPDTVSLSEKIPADEYLSDGTTQGKNDWGKTGYGGPCPPSGTHRYFFKIYVLNSMPELKPGLTKKELLSAITGHIIAEGQLMGRYKRS